MNIGRTQNSEKRCSYPSCTEKFGLHTPSQILRYELLKLKSLYIPKRGKVCDDHSEICLWRTINVDISAFPFTTEQINDIIELLRKQPESLKGIQSGKN